MKEHTHALPRLYEGIRHIWPNVLSDHREFRHAGCNARSRPSCHWNMRAMLSYGEERKQKLKWEEMY